MLRSSSSPPSPCITPSTETCVTVVSFMVRFLLVASVVVRSVRRTERGSGSDDLADREHRAGGIGEHGGAADAGVRRWHQDTAAELTRPGRDGVGVVDPE